MYVRLDIAALFTSLFSLPEKELKLLEKGILKEAFSE